MQKLYKFIPVLLLALFPFQSHAQQINSEASDVSFRTDDGFVTRGKLTIKGVTRIVTIPFAKEGNTLRGTFSLNRLDYNVGDGVSTFLVSDAVEVTISSVLMP